jgi:hypothetical protein
MPSGKGKMLSGKIKCFLARQNAFGQGKMLSGKAKAYEVVS